MSTNASTSNQEAQISELIDNVIVTYLTAVKEIKNDKQFLSAILSLENVIFYNFSKGYLCIKDHELYKNVFLNAVRSTQDSFLHDPLYLNTLLDIRSINGQLNKKRPFLDAVGIYCQQKENCNRDSVIRYLIKTEAVLGVWHTINGTYLSAAGKIETKPEKKQNSMTAEQKNAILKYLIDKQDEGTLDGKVIAKELGLNVKHVMDLLEDFKRRDYITLIGMAQYYFQVTVKLDGQEFHDAGGYIAKESNSFHHHASNLLNSASFGNNTNIIIGSHNSQHISYTEVKAGDFQSLKETLQKNHVSDDDINELKDVIDVDQPDRQQKTFGKKVNEWMKKMLGKSVDASWKVGISVAGKLLADAIQAYYGMSS